jgi:predicted nucleotide-binding protein
VQERGKLEMFRVEAVRDRSPMLARATDACAGIEGTVLPDWSRGLFRLGSVGLDDLVRAANGFDFAVFVFAPDDLLTMRDKQHSVVRDNVLFELGVLSENWAATEFLHNSGR